jgi:signal transduction histidine kinase
MQVLLNLIGNAIKFTPGEGKITITAELDSSEWIQISVSDTGQGIGAAECEKIFSKFYQVAEIGKSKPRGTGLGLAISKALVELHGGKIWVQSDLNSGSTFFFTLPLTPPKNLAHAR